MKKIIMTSVLQVVCIALVIVSIQAEVLGGVIGFGICGYVEKGWGGYNEKTDAFIQPLVAGSTPCLKGSKRYDYNHTSGHASIQSLKEICELIGPKTAIIPIHHSPDADFHTVGLRKDLDDKIVEAETVIDGITITFNKA